MIKLLGVVTFDRDTETMGVHIVNHHVVVFPQNADDLSSLILLAINSVVFHVLKFDVVSIELEGKEGRKFPFLLKPQEAGVIADQHRLSREPQSRCLMHTVIVIFLYKNSSSVCKNYFGDKRSNNALKPRVYFRQAFLQQEVKTPRRQ